MGPITPSRPPPSGGGVLEDSFLILRSRMICERFICDRVKRVNCSFRGPLNAQPWAGGLYIIYYIIIYNLYCILYYILFYVLYYILFYIIFYIIYYITL